jgi:hypothetical protein
MQNAANFLLVNFFPPSYSSIFSPDRLKETLSASSANPASAAGRLA